MKNWYRQQGDVVIKRIDSTPPGVKKLPTSVLQEGEHTGHAHRLMFRHDDRGVSGVFQDAKSLTKYLKLDAPAMLSHEEHESFEIPAGDYRIDIVQEFDHFAEEARNVAD